MASRPPTVLRTAQDALVFARPDGRIASWSAAAERLFGWTADQVTGRPFGELLAQDDAVAELLAAVTAGSAVDERLVAGRTSLGDLLSLVVSLVPVHDPAGRPAGAMLAARDVAEDDDERDHDRTVARAVARARFIAHASQLLSESLDHERTLEAVGSMMVPAWADVCAVGLRDEEGALELRTVACAEPLERALVEEMLAEHAIDPEPGGFVERVLASGRAVIAPEYRDPVPRPGRRLRRGLRATGGRSLIIAPLRIRGTVIGVMFAAMTSASERRFVPADVDLVQDAADRSAQAIDNARLFAAERAARGVAEEAVLAARAAEERFRAAFDQAPIGIALLTVDDAGRTTYAEVNPALCQITGHTRDELIGRDVEQLGAAQEGAGSERRIVRADGQERWVQVRAAPLSAGLGATHAFVAQVEDITDRRRFERELEHLASHDPLTGLLNRRRFEEELEQALAHVRRHGDPAAIVTLDLDNLKRVNDTYGHAAGDQLLRAAAAALQERVRATDSVGRLGGDEFGIVLTRSGGDEAASVAEGLLEAFRTRVSITVGERTVRVTASAGVRSLAPDESQTAGELLGEADMAMYHAKEGGRDRLSVVGLHDLRPERVNSRMRWAERIRDALESDGFVLYEQPILRLDGERMDSAELLIRMLDNAGRPILPPDFLPVAERYGHIRAIDRWVVHRAIALLHDRKAFGNAVGAEVNLSGDSITDASVIDYIVAEIRNAGIDPAQLTFEITETAAIGNMNRAQRLSQQLSELGCRFALDDFGAGFGSFSYLKHLPLDIIKIDGDFIRSLPSSPQDQVTVRAIVDIAKGLGKQTVAEFVEDQPTLDLLRRLGVDRAQGFHVGRPRPILVSPDF